MHDPADFLSDVALGTDIGSHGIHRTGDAGILQREPVEPDDVVAVDPCEPLPAVPQGTADEESKWQGQQAERKRAAGEDHGGADPDHTDTNWIRPFVRALP